MTFEHADTDSLVSAVRVVLILILSSLLFKVRIDQRISSPVLFPRICLSSHGSTLYENIFLFYHSQSASIRLGTTIFNLETILDISPFRVKYPLLTVSHYVICATFGIYHPRT